MKRSKSGYQEILFLAVFILIKFILSYALVNDVYELHRDEFLHLLQENFVG